VLFAIDQASPVKASWAARRRCSRWIRRWMIERSMGETSTAFGSPLHGPNLTAAGQHPTQRFKILTEMVRPAKAGEPIFHHSPRCERQEFNAQATNPQTHDPPIRLMWRQYDLTKHWLDCPEYHHIDNSKRDHRQSRTQACYWSLRRMMIKVKAWKQ